MNIRETAEKDKLRCLQAQLKMAQDETNGAIEAILFYNRRATDAIVLRNAAETQLRTVEQSAAEQRMDLERHRTALVEAAIPLEVLHAIEGGRNRSLSAHLNAQISDAVALIRACLPTSSDTKAKV